MSLLGATVELSLSRPADGGGFVGRLEDGRVVFVRHGLSGERVRAVITEEHARWARADAIEILDASPDRVTPPCRYFSPEGCGGCDYQHVSLPAQRALKAQLLGDQLRRVAGIERSVVVEGFSESGLGTRTRVRFGTNPSGHLAMRRRQSRDLVPVDRCLLGVAAICSMDLDYEEWPAGDDVQVVALNGADHPTIALVEWNDEIEDDATGEAAELLEDEDEAGVQWTEVGDIPYQVSADSFFQIHTRAPELLTEAVLEGLGLRGGETVLDLYAGVGLFTVPIARAVGETGSVLAIESSPSAVADAQVNLEHVPWARVVEASVTVQTLSPYLNDAVAAVVDPPRSGVDKKALAMLASSALSTIVMVSCSPATFARDLKVLLGEGWKLQSLRAFDLFEMTEHLEIVAVLTHEISDEL